MQKTFQHFCLPFLAIGGLLAVIPNIQAATVFSDFSAGMTYAPPGNGTQIFGATSSHSPAGYEAEAMAFTPGGNYLFSKIDIALQYGGIGTNSVVVNLATDVGGIPGATLESWTVTPSTTGTGYETVTDSLGILLKGGTQYWIEATPGATDTTAIWNSNLMDLGNAAVNKGSGWVDRNTPPVGYQLGAFDVQGTAVPEPASIGLILGGFAVLAGAVRRRKA